MLKKLFVMFTVVGALSVSHALDGDPQLNESPDTTQASVDKPCHGHNMNLDLEETSGFGQGKAGGGSTGKAKKRFDDPFAQPCIW